MPAEKARLNARARPGISPRVGHLASNLRPSGIRELVNISVGRLPRRRPNRPGDLFVYGTGKAAVDVDPTEFVRVSATVETALGSPVRKYGKVSVKAHPPMG